MLKDRLLSALLAVAVSMAACVAIVRFTPAAPEVSPAQLEQGVTFVFFVGQNAEDGRF